jgi:transposase
MACGREERVEIINRRCAGLDVHRGSVAVCRRVIDEHGEFREEVRTFGTTTHALLEMSDWLSESSVTVVAMESTGVYWKPIWNVLEGRFEIVLVNAKHIKHVPGRKTDVKDCQWIAQLLQHGLLKSSFVPPAPIRELRDLTRHRTQLVGEKTSAANRIHKILEDANIKLGSVASDILGESGRAMLHAIVGGETDPARLAALARGRMRSKKSELREALHGRVRDHHRFMLRTLMEHLQFLEGQIARLSERIEALTAPFVEAVRILVTIPGVQRRTAEALIAETGGDMKAFPSANHLASWAGICPGNNESAGKRRTGSIPKGNVWLRRALTEAAWAASRTKGTYLSARYRRLAARRGAKRALVAVAHGILTTAYHMLQRGQAHHDLGPDYFDRLDPKALTRSLVRRLERLGHNVTLAPAA